MIEGKCRPTDRGTPSDVFVEQGPINQRMTKKLKIAFWWFLGPNNISEKKKTTFLYFVCSAVKFENKKCETLPFR